MIIFGFARQSSAMPEQHSMTGLPEQPHALKTAHRKAAA
jgi:hypothetical protein